MSDAVGARSTADAIRHRAEQWTSRGHDPDLVELVGLIRTAAQEVIAGSDAVLADHGLSRGQFDVLSALYRAGADVALTQADLANAMLLTPAGMKKRIDALAAAGLIARTPDPDDSRKQQLRLTPQGEGKVTVLLDAFFAAEKATLARLGDSEREALRVLLRRLLGGV